MNTPGCGVGFTLRALSTPGCSDQAVLGGLSVVAALESQPWGLRGTGGGSLSSSS